MSASIHTKLFDSPLVRITAMARRHPRSRCGCELGKQRTHPTLLRRNGFGYHINGTAVIGDPTAALLYRTVDSFRSTPQGVTRRKVRAITVNHRGTLDATSI